MASCGGLATVGNPPLCGVGLCVARLAGTGRPSATRPQDTIRLKPAPPLSEQYRRASLAHASERDGVNPDGAGDFVVELEGLLAADGYGQQVGLGGNHQRVRNLLPCIIAAK